MAFFGNLNYAQGLPQNLPQRHVRRHANLEYTHFDILLEMFQRGQPVTPQHYNVHLMGLVPGQRDGLTHLQVWETAINMTETVLAIDVPRTARYSQIVSSNLSGYSNAMRVGIIVRTVLGLYYGFDQVYTAQNCSLDSIRSHLQNRIAGAQDANQLAQAQHDCAYFHNYVLRLVDFLLKWRINPTYGIIVSDIFTCSMISFRRLVTRTSGRAGSPLWSYAKLANHALSQRDSAICNGHMLEFALQLDRVMVNFDRVVPQEVSHVLPHENVAALFQLNRQHRLYHAL